MLRVSLDFTRQVGIVRISMNDATDREETLVHQCPRCGKPSRVRTTSVGKQVRCPHCKEPSIVTPSGSSTTPSPSANASASDSSTSRRMADTLDFAQEKTVDLAANSSQEDSAGPRSASGRRRSPTSTALRAPTPGTQKAGASGTHGRPTTRRNRVKPPGSGASGAHRAVRPSGIHPPSPGGEKIWLYIAGGLFVVIGILVFALLKLVR